MARPRKVVVRCRIADIALSLARLKSQAGKVIILMYHQITDSVEEDPEQHTVSTRIFSQQMVWLRELGYPVLPLSVAVGRLRAQRLDSPMVSITFDDGYRSTYTHAFPALQRHGYPATVFLVPGAMTGACSRDFTRERLGHLLNWAEAREMFRHGITFGAHGMTHRKLSKLPDHEVEREVGDSKRAIEDALSTEVTEFSYPFGSFDSFTRSTEAIVRRYRFNAICTAITGHNRSRRDAHRLKRLRISWTDDSMREIQKQCLGAYNWYALYQRCQHLGLRTGG